MEPLRDGATGVYSWEALNAFGTPTASQTKRRGGALSILVVTPDPPRDSDGPTSGLEDAAQRVLAGVLLKTVRGGDMVGRYGRRSFSILAQDAQRAGALRLAERIRSALPEHLTLQSQQLTFTVSIGIAVLPDSGATLSDVVAAAERAVADARALGGNRACIAEANDAVAQSAAASEVQPAEPLARVDQEALTAQRQSALAQALQAVERGDLEGVGLETQPGACAVCLDAARDLYLPAFIPSLPLTGCTGPVGCRCIYAVPAIDPRRRPPPIPAARFDTLDVPRRFRDAAFFGSNPKGSCKPEDLAQYLERYPLIPVPVEIDLQAGEVAYLVRPARRAWENDMMARTPVLGPVFPMEGQLEPWLKRLGKAPSLYDTLASFKDEGTLYITNWRLLFNRRGSIDSHLLVDINQVEYLRDGVALRIGDRISRQFVLVRDPLSVGMVLVQAIRDATIPVS